MEVDGWTLLSSEERHAAHPGSFVIPSREARESLTPGAAVKLLFDIETQERGRVIDRGVDRMWVIVRSACDGRYEGVLDNDPGAAEHLNLRAGDIIVFGPEHVAAIDHPPREYLIRKYGDSWFDKT